MTANEALVRRYADAVWNRGDLDLLDELVSPEYRFLDPETGEVLLRGPDGLKAIVSEIRRAFPDHTLEVEDVIVADEQVVWRWRMHGTHLGAFMGIAPTGRRVSTTGIAIYRIRDGRIVERWGEADTLGLLAQLDAGGHRVTEVTIKAQHNGPYLVTGPVTIVDADGTPYDVGEKKVVALCRCGGSTTKPFCDGTHSRKGFEAAERAVAAEG